MRKCGWTTSHIKKVGSLVKHSIGVTVVKCFAVRFGNEEVFVGVDVVFQEPVSDDHVNSGRFDEL